ncbi:hypothetical protein EDD16DRAFT_1519054 [Pisolithus croceorrhizus]|nr:hypothetical protein EDD16DRAFT_1519054 [Pisolithus croceorrhizus]
MAFAVKAIRAALDTFKMGDVMAPLCHVTCRGAVEQGNFSATPSADERRGGIPYQGTANRYSGWDSHSSISRRCAGGDSILETAHAALSVFITDYYLIAHYGQVQVLQSATWLVRLDLQVRAAVYLVVFLIDFVACLYFKWRVWRFTKKMWIVIFTAMNVRSGYPSALTTLVRYPSLYHEPGSNRPLLAGSALFLFGDIFSASMMAYYPKKNRRGLQSKPAEMSPRLMDVVTLILDEKKGVGCGCFLYAKVDPCVLISIQVLRKANINIGGEQNVLLLP